MARQEWLSHRGRLHFDLRQDRIKQFFVGGHAPQDANRVAAEIRRRRDLRLSIGNQEKRIAVKDCDRLSGLGERDIAADDGEIRLPLVDPRSRFGRTGRRLDAKPDGCPFTAQDLRGGREEPCVFSPGRADDDAQLRRPRGEPELRLPAR